MDCAKLSQYIARFEAVSFAVTRRLNMLIRDTIDKDLTLDQYLILRYIHLHGACTSTELSETFCVNKSATTAIISRLVDKEYIKRDVDDKDRRVIYLTMTGKGGRMHKDVEERIHNLLGPLIGQFTQPEIDHFLMSYEKLANIVNQMDGGTKG